MSRGLLTMSQHEVERTSIIEQVVHKRMKQGKAGELLKISVRQVKRLVRAYRREGTQGLISRRRGRLGNHRHEEEMKSVALGYVRQHYVDFGPTLASEKLRERHQLDVNKETLRQWMMAAGLWQAKRQKKVKIHQSRLRRSCFGELIQLDGSHHDWFEGRSKPCCLYVLIDDATSQLVGLWFEAQETTAGYFHVVRDYLARYGRPLAFYSDKDSVFRVNHAEAVTSCETQFKRAMRELDIELICADSPQAKGRVERANGTLQDRLVKEMRLMGIDTMATANAFLLTFMKDYNRRFAVAPRSQVNAHRQELPDTATLDCVFSIQQTRILSKNLELSYQGVIYQVKTQGIGYGLRHARVTVCESLRGEVTLLYKGRRLAYERYKKEQRASTPIVSAKQLNHAMKQVAGKASIPSKEHPWRHYVINPAKAAAQQREAERSSYPQGPQGACA